MLRDRAARAAFDFVAYGLLVLLLSIVAAVLGLYCAAIVMLIARASS